MSRYPKFSPLKRRRVYADDDARDALVRALRAAITAIRDLEQSSAVRLKGERS